MTAQVSLCERRCGQRQGGAQHCDIWIVEVTALPFPNRDWIGKALNLCFPFDRQLPPFSSNVWQGPNVARRQPGLYPQVSLGATPFVTIRPDRLRIPRAMARQKVNPHLLTALVVGNALHICPNNIPLSCAFLL
jgi:hypothetical protein